MFLTKYERLKGKGEETSGRKTKWEAIKYSRHGYWGPGLADRMEKTKS